VAVADVPDPPLSTLRGRGQDLSASGNVCLSGGGSCHHGVMLAGVVCHDGGEVRCFVHAVILQGQGRTIWDAVDSASAVTFLAGSLV